MTIYDPLLSSKPSSAVCPAKAFARKKKNGNANHDAGLRYLGTEEHFATSGLTNSIHERAWQTLIWCSESIETIIRYD